MTTWKLWLFAAMWTVTFFAVCYTMYGTAHLLRASVPGAIGVACAFGAGGVVGLFCKIGIDRVCNKLGIEP